MVNYSDVPYLLAHNLYSKYTAFGVKIKTKNANSDVQGGFMIVL